jgi:hypothetical protein
MVSDGRIWYSSNFHLHIISCVSYNVRYMISKTCVTCEQEFFVHTCREKTAKCCSQSCTGVYVGVLRRKNAKPRLSYQGYFFIKKPEHYRANSQGYVKVADLVLEKKLGRRLEKNEIAHHKNEIKTDDSPENLEVMDSYMHTLMHHEKRRKKKNEANCVICGLFFRRPGSDSKKYCSRKCMAVGFSKPKK